MNRVIFHIDVNSSLLSWEAVYRPHHLGGKLDLRDIACIRWITHRSLKANLEETLNEFLHQFFGVKSEKTPPKK